MFQPREWRFRIEHILSAIDKIRVYVADHTEESLSKDEKTLDAIVRNFQVIGEAARRVPDAVQKAHADIPWSDMQRMRHVLVHDYDEIKPQVVWKTIQDDLPPLVEPLKRILENPAD